MRSLTCLLAALTASFALTAAQIPLPDIYLDVSIKSLAHTKVELRIRNNGTSTIVLLDKGNVLDKHDTQKLQVYDDADGKVPFAGILKTVSTKDLAGKTTALAPEEIITILVETAGLHDLSKGGRHSVVARGAIPYHRPGAGEFGGIAYYTSNQLSMNVNGKMAASIHAYHSHQLETRGLVDAKSCSGPLQNVTQAGLTTCQKMAQTAAATIDYDSDQRLEEYFGTASPEAKGVMVARYLAYARECGRVGNGYTTTYCDNGGVDPICDGAVAYANVRTNKIVDCQKYFSIPPTPECDEGADLDQGSTTLHEMTHNPRVFSPFCDDHVYGLGPSLTVDASLKMSNADNWVFYAINVYKLCG